MGSRSVFYSALVSFGLALFCSSAFSEATTVSSSRPAKNTIDNPVIGIQIGEINANLRKSFVADGFINPGVQGLIVLSVLPSSPAERAGIKKLHILSITWKKHIITTSDEFSEWAKTLQVGQEQVLKSYIIKTGSSGKLLWVSQQVKVKPAPRSEVVNSALRHLYIKIDSEWLKIPELDLTKSSSRTDITSGKRAREQDMRQDSIPEVKVGEYGILPCTVFQIIGPKDMLVKAWGETIRIYGYSTAELTDDRFLSKVGPIAIVGTWNYTTVIGGGKTVFLAVPLKIIQNGLSDAEYKELQKNLDSGKLPDSGPLGF